MRWEQNKTPRKMPRMMGLNGFASSFSGIFLGVLFCYALAAVPGPTGSCFLNRSSLSCNPGSSAATQGSQPGSQWLYHLETLCNKGLICKLDLVGDQPGDQEFNCLLYLVLTTRVAQNMAEISSGGGALRE